MLIEYQVRPVTRYIITRFETSGPSDDGKNTSCCGTKGEYENGEVAYEIAYALCRAEHERLGWQLDDMRILYPRHETIGTSSGIAPL